MLVKVAAFLRLFVDWSTRVYLSFRLRGETIREELDVAGRFSLSLSLLFFHLFFSHSLILSFSRQEHTLEYPIETEVRRA